MGYDSAQLLNVAHVFWCYSRAPGHGKRSPEALFHLGRSPCRLTVRIDYHTI